MTPFLPSQQNPAHARRPTVTEPPTVAEREAAERAARIADAELRLAHDRGGQRFVERIRRLGMTR